MTKRPDEIALMAEGGREIRNGSDGWMVRTRDGKLSAQFEHAVVLTRNGVKVLTLRPEEASRLPARTAP